MRTSVWVTAAILSGSLCWGQSVSAGVIGGAMVSNDLGNVWLSSVSTRYAVGPQLDIGLPFGFGFEADALYRHEGYEITFNSCCPGLYATSWQFPLLLKKTLGVPFIKPLLEAGYAPRRIEATAYGGPFTSHGVVIGGGARLAIGRLQLEPVVRYTRWNNNPVLAVIPNGPSPYLSANQVDLLLGVSWKFR